MNNQAFIWMLLRAQKVAESLFAKYIRIALATFRKFDDSFGYAVAGVKTAPVSLNSLASHFECNAQDPRRFRVKLLVAEEWCDWHDAYPLAVSFYQKRTPKPLITRRVGWPLFFRPPQGCCGVVSNAQFLTVDSISAISEYTQHHFVLPEGSSRHR
jgi:hypothetical protein